MASHQTVLLLVSALLQVRHECNNTLPVGVLPLEQQVFPNVTASYLEAILRCPANTHQRTCSCSSDCSEYGDCCWQAANPNATDGHPAVKNVAQPRWVCQKTPVSPEVNLFVFMVSRCGDSWPYNDDIRSDCERPMSNDTFRRIPVTSSSGVTYRNGFCALCNYEIENATFWNASDATGTNSSAVVFSVPTRVASVPSEYLRTCSPRAMIETCPQTTSAETRELCRRLLTPVRSDDGTLYKNAYCAFCNGVDPDTLSCSPDTNPDVFTTTGISSSNSLGTQQAVVERPSCLAWYNGTCYIESAMYRYATPSEEESWTLQGYLIVISLTLSMICLLLKAVVFAAYRQARSFSAQCILCLSMTLLATQLLFLLAMCLDDITPEACTASALVLHYGFVSTFFWTTVLSYDIWDSIVIVSTNRSQQFFRYCLAGWVSPAVLLIIPSVLNWAGDNLPFSPHYGVNLFCFINGRAAYFAFFIGPMAALLLVDVGFYTHIVVLIRRTAKQTKKFDFKGNEKYSRAVLFAKLALIMGVEWLIALIKQFVHSPAIETISSVVIGLQGVYLFLGFKDYKHFLTSCRRSRTTYRASQHSTTSSSTLATVAEVHSMNDVSSGSGQTNPAATSR